MRRLSSAFARFASSRMRLIPFAYLIACGLAACTVGPDYHPPQTHLPENWHALAHTGADAADRASATSAASAPRAPTVAVDSDPDPRWWRSFHDSTLDALIDRARAGNLDLQQAVLRIVEARTQMQSTAAQGLPNLRANASYQREQLGLKGLLQSNGVYRDVDQLGAPNSPVDAIAPGAGLALQRRASDMLGQLRYGDIPHIVRSVRALSKSIQLIKKRDTLLGQLHQPPI